MIPLSSSFHHPLGEPRFCVAVIAKLCLAPFKCVWETRKGHPLKVVSHWG